MLRKGLILLTCMSMIWVNYKMYDSSIYQAYLMYDFNANTLNFPLYMVKKIDSTMPPESRKTAFCLSNTYDFCENRCFT